MARGRDRGGRRSRVGALALAGIAGVLLAIAIAAADASGGGQPAVATGFGSNGSATVPFPAPSGAGLTDAHQSQVLAITTDAAGRLLVAGSAYATDTHSYRVGAFCVARMSSAGALDVGFGSQGVACLTPQADANQAPASVSVDPTTGAIVLAGISTTNTTFQSSLYLARFTADGQPDTGFGSGGLLKGPDVATASHAGAVVQSSGDIVAAYVAKNAGALTLTRVHAGAVDATYGSGGTTALSISAPYYSQILAEQPDDSVDVVGIKNQAIALQHLGKDGALDTAFGSGGIASVPATSSEYPYSAALQGTKILVSGTAYPASPGGPYQAVAARFTPDGALDTGFGSGGKVVTTPPSGVTNLYGGPIVYDPDPGVDTIDATDGGLQVCTSDQDGHDASCPLSLGGNVQSATAECSPGVCVAFVGGDENETAVVKGVSLRSGSGDGGGSTPPTSSTTTTTPAACPPPEAKTGFTQCADFDVANSDMDVLVNTGLLVSFATGGVGFEGSADHGIVEGETVIVSGTFVNHGPASSECIVTFVARGSDRVGGCFAPNGRSVIPPGDGRFRGSAPIPRGTGSIAGTRYTTLVSVAPTEAYDPAPQNNRATSPSFVVYSSTDAAPDVSRATATGASGTIAPLKSTGGRGFRATGGSAITRVEVAIATGGTKGCRWVRTTRSALTRMSAKACANPVWLKATGTMHWRLRLTRRLPKGRYVVEAQAFDARGARSPIAAGGVPSQRAFTVR